MGKTLVGQEIVRGQGMNRLLSVAFWVMLAVCVGWILSLPVFPTQDGPMHLYWAQVFRGLLDHSHQYDGFFRIRAVMSPYSLYYFLLLGLTQVFSPPMADKIVVCIVVAVFTIGFRMLARSVGGAGDVVGLFGFPLILGWCLGMGFVSYTLCLGFGLVALALWFQHVRHAAGVGYDVAFLAILVLMAITHPLPLLMVLAIAFLDLALGVVWDRRWRRWSRQDRRALVTSALGSLTVLYVFHFTDTNRVRVRDVGRHMTVVRQSLRLLSLHSLSLFRGTRPLTALYSLGLYLMFFGALWMTVRAWRRGEGRSHEVVLFGVLAVLLFVALPLFPEQMNGGKYFADRLMPVVWVAALMAASCVKQRSARVTYGVAGFAMLMFVLLLVQGEQYLRPEARASAQMETMAVPETGALAGIAVNGSHGQVKSGLTTMPQYWQEMRYLRREHAVMLNLPWLSESILPLADGPEEMTRILPPEVLDDPKWQMTMLPEMVEDREKAREKPAEFAAFFYGIKRSEGATFRASLDQANGGPWTCDDNARMMLCRPAPEAGDNGGLRVGRTPVHP